MKCKGAFLALNVGLTLLSCATPTKNSYVSTRLAPIHSEVLDQLFDGDGRASVLDNDGNLYITTWALRAADESVFSEKVRLCDRQVKDKQVFNKPFDIKEVDENALHPALFKEHTQCIASHGFMLKGKEGFSPDKYRLSIFRGQSISGQYIPVGAHYFISKKNTSYLAVYKFVNECTHKIESEVGGGVIEEHVGGAIHVSIKPYADFIEKCMTDFEFFVEGAGVK